MELTKEKLIERWEQVARVLEELPPHEKRRHFFMGDWGGETACGTVACAAGHCAMDPWFRRRGFSAQLVGRKGARSLEPTGNRTWGDMVEEFFGLPDPPEDPVSPDWTDYDLKYAGISIFYNGNPRPASAVVREIRAYIKRLKSNP